MIHTTQLRQAQTDAMAPIDLPTAKFVVGAILV